MTARQRLFVAAYLRHFNAQRAAIEAGYSPRGLRAWHLLQKPAIEAAVEEGMKERIAQTRRIADRIVIELGRIAFADPRDLYQWDGKGVLTLREPERLDDENAGAISVLPAPRGGEPPRVGLHDKTAALELLARHVGLFHPRAKIVEHDNRPESFEARRALRDRLARMLEVEKAKKSE